MDESLKYDPVDYYEKVLKDNFFENASNYFDELVKKTNTNVDENKITSEKIRKEEHNDKKNESKLSKFKILQGFLIFFTVIGFLLLIFGTFAVVNSFFELIVNIILVVIGIILPIGSLLIILLYTRKKVKQLKEIDLLYNAKLKELYNEARNQLSYLNDTFTYYDFSNILKKTTDAFEIDEKLEPLKLLMLKKVYGLVNEPNENESIVGVYSGNISTNPFIRFKVYSKTMQDKVYTGTKTITWTERVKDSSGGYKTVTRSQVLTATAVHPAPVYSYQGYTVYGNEAAPDLTFSRGPTKLGINPSEKEVEKYVKKYEDDLQKLAQKSISKGGTFQPLANSKFEVLFNALNRNNETQFRLLFTPLAQQNMCEVITRSVYGDDFAYYKINKINIVQSLHSTLNFEFDDNSLRDFYDIDILKENFVTTMSNLFSSLYFDIAPFLAIPLYQLTEGGKFNLLDENSPHISFYEAEAFANQMDQSLFYPNMAKTPQILKVSLNKSFHKSDIYDVLSSSYTTEQRVDYVSVYGGDGRYHQVAVRWVEYLPVTKTSSICIRHFEGGEKEFNNLINDNEFQKTLNNTLVSSPSSKKKILGFYLGECYNYDNNFDDKLDEIIERFTLKK